MAYVPGLDHDLFVSYAHADDVTTANAMGSTDLLTLQIRPVWPSLVAAR
jgi:hypothetical protein